MHHTKLTTHGKRGTAKHEGNKSFPIGLFDSRGDRNPYILSISAPNNALTEVQTNYDCK